MKKLCALLVIVAFSAAALAGAPAAGPKPPPPPVNPNSVPGLAEKEGYVRCPKCGNWHQPDYVCCCPVCGGCHPKNLECKAERAAPVREALCPVCERRFNAPLPFRRNSEGGWDRDFCRHSMGASAVESLVWMCPRCGYARLTPENAAELKPAEVDFNKPVTPELAKAVKNKLQPLVGKRLRELAGGNDRLLEALEQTDIPDRIKYELALETADLRQAPASEKAKLALEGSYACRRALVAPVEFPALSAVIISCERNLAFAGAREKDQRRVAAAIEGLLRAAEKEPVRGEPPPPKLSAVEAFYLQLRLAGVRDRLGERAGAVAALEAAGKAAGKLRGDEAKLLEGLLAARRALLEAEGKFRARAVAALRQALLADGAYGGEQLPPTVYQLGELYRRQEEFGKAKVWLSLGANLAANDKLLPFWISEALASEQLKSAAPDDDEEAAAVAFVEKMTGRKPVIKGGPEPRPPPRPAERAPANCAECLGNIARAYAAFVAKNGKAPAELADLVAGGFITEVAAGAFKCPETGAAYVYRPPKDPRSAAALVIFHSNPKKTACKKSLFADGAVKDLE